MLLANEAPRARAYCGSAHGRSWDLDPQAPPPARVRVRLGTQVLHYRLVRDPRRNRPARDHLGHYLYMPLREAISRADYAA